MNQNKSEHNPVHKKYMRIVMPVYGIICLSFIVVTSVLGSIDDDKYNVPIFILFGVFILASSLILLTLPLMRKKAVEEDIKRYDFDTSTLKDEDEYRFEQRDMIESFVMAKSPFNDMDTSPLLIKGDDNLKEFIDSVSTKIVALNDIQLSHYDSQLTVAVSDDNNNFYEVLQAPLGENIKVDIFLKNEVVFNKDGITLNGLSYPYSKFNARLNGYTFKMRVFLKAEYAIEDLNNNNEEYLFIHLKYDKNIINAMNKFGLVFENQYIADKILSDVPKAFNKMLTSNYFNKLEKEHLKQTNKNKLQ